MCGGVTGRDGRLLHQHLRITIAHRQPFWTRYYGLRPGKLRPQLILLSLFSSWHHHTSAVWTVTHLAYYRDIKQQWHHAWKLLLRSLHVHYFYLPISSLLQRWCFRASSWVLLLWMLVWGLTGPLFYLDNVSLFVRKQEETQHPSKLIEPNNNADWNPLDDWGTVCLLAP